MSDTGRATFGLAELVRNGKIRDQAGLKRAYRQLVLKTHPDSAGSNAYLEAYFKIGEQYEEARLLLASRQPEKKGAGPDAETNPRLAFFRALGLIEALEAPYAFHPGENAIRLVVVKRDAQTALAAWRPDIADLYAAADKELVKIKNTKPRGPYLKHALSLNIRPVFHNIIAYHLSGRELYAKQLRQNLSVVMEQIALQGFASLHSFLSFLLEDAKEGPAIFSGGSGG